jgi:hypothetical protein
MIDDRAYRLCRVGPIDFDARKFQVRCGVLSLACVQSRIGRGVHSEERAQVERVTRDDAAAGMVRIADGPRRLQPPERS